MLLRTLQQQDLKKAARRQKDLREIMDESKTQLSSMIAFSRRVVRSWRPSMALLGYLQGSGHRAQELQHKLAQVGIIDKTAYRFTTIARHLTDMRQDPMSRYDATRLDAWILHFKHRSEQLVGAELGGLSINFVELRAALTKAR